MKIKKGDKVKVILGKDRGRSGEVLKVFPKSKAVVVKGLNIFKKHLKPSQGQKGQIIEKEGKLTISKVMLVCPKCQKSTRVAYSIDKTGQKSRLCKKCGSQL